MKSMEGQLGLGTILKFEFFWRLNCSNCSCNDLANLEGSPDPYNVIGLIVSCFAPQQTRHEPKSALFLTDPSLARGTSVKISIFLPTNADHPQCERMGDIFIARRARRN